MHQSKREKLFDDIVQRYGRFLERVLWKLTGNGDLFADAWQEVLLAIWRHVEKLDGPKAGGYLYRIALSSAQKAWQKKPPSHPEATESVIDPAPSPNQQIADKELITLVRRLLTELPQQQSRAIVMRYLESNDYDQMAQELDCSQAAARSHVSKALATLKKKMNRIVVGV